MSVSFHCYSVKSLFEYKMSEVPCSKFTTLFGTIAQSRPEGNRLDDRYLSTFFIQETDKDRNIKYMYNMFRPLCFQILFSYSIK